MYGTGCMSHVTHTKWSFVLYFFTLATLIHSFIYLFLQYSFNHRIYVRTAITALAKSSKNRHYMPETDNQQEELWPKALDLLKQMDQDGIEPDGFCYSSAINCCGAEGRWEEACKLIETMKRGGPKSRPNKVAYTSAISEYFIVITRID